MIHIKEESIVKSAVITAMLPFIGLFQSIKDNKTNAYPIVFAIFFFFIGTQTIATDSNDFGRYMMTFSQLSNTTDSSFFDYFYSLREGSQIDFYKPFVTWLVSRVTSNAQLFAGILAMMFGFCFSFNFRYIAKQIDSQSLLALILLITLFFIPKASYCHRWWMALQVFLLGAMPYILENKRTYLLFSVASVLIHFSFLYPLILLLLYRFLPQKALSLYILMFIVANLISSLNIASIANLFDQFLPVSFVSRNEMYINAELANHNFFSQSAKYVWKYTNIALITYIYIKFKDLLEEIDGIRGLLVVALIIGSFAAIADLTEWGWRYLDVSNFMFCSLYILIYAETENDEVNFTKAIRIASPCLIYVILFQLRGLLSTIGIKALFLGNIITTWLIKDSHSIISYLQ